MLLKHRSMIMHIIDYLKLIHIYLRRIRIIY
nr:MAG TPA: hypothetical protein [Caudoviricetes sp.]